MRRLVHPTTLGVLALALACGGGDAGDDAGAPDDPGPEAQPVETTADEPDPADGGGAETVSGANVFVTNCATCHGESGTGEGPAAVGLEPPPADLSDAEWVTGDGSYDAVRNTIENGSPGTAMIGWKGTLTEAELDAVTQHVLSLSDTGD